MPNIAAVLKSEISRIARKEIRAVYLDLKKVAAAHRSEIASLKKRAKTLEQQLRGVDRKRSKPEPAAGSEAQQDKRRFSAKGLASQRKRLGLSAADCGLLLGTSGQSVYNWEAGTARPRARHLEAIAALRTLGRKAAAAHLESIKK